MAKTETKKESFKGKLGGKRPGAGRKKGKKTPAVIEREIAFKEMRDRIAKNTDRLLSAQFSIALGQQFLYRIDSRVEGKRTIKEKPVLVTAEWEIRAFLDGEFDDEPDKYYYITTKEPDNNALRDMFDRTYGKSKENIDIKTNGELTIKIVKYGDSAK